ncbi:hypothetical protein [Acinetobacter courvalinii]|uniref:hypothetical protein n=1 Tax=Acinetobacter courvalinii TaxID=280147 RepID=UPI0021CFFA44|nr:hypothetical protein [Acinetobacter courvalinii]MCU4369592.1 hypothetical protein [Acinetobacter courvalinii]MCU4447797.1 hypothetical protein [Acinetobacter courvalinii]
MKKALLFLFLIFMLLLPWAGGWLFSMAYVAYQPECLTRFSFAYVHSQGEMDYSEGTFSLTPSPWGTGSGVYTGALYHNAEKYPVHLSFTYDYHLSQGIATVKMLTVSPELGNQASLSNIAKYVSPTLKVGETNRTRFILLNGEKLASGTTKFPRMVCTN